MNILRDPNVVSALIGVAGALLGVVVGFGLTLYQQKSTASSERDNLVNVLAMELDDQSTSVLYVYEYLRRLGDGKKVFSENLFGLANHLPAKPHVFLGNIGHLATLDRNVAKYLVHYHSDVDRSRKITASALEALGLNKSKSLSPEQLATLNESWRGTAWVEALAIERLLSFHGSKIESDAKSLLVTSAKLLRGARDGTLEWDLPGDITKISLKRENVQ